MAKESKIFNSFCWQNTIKLLVLHFKPIELK